MRAMLDGWCAEEGLSWDFAPWTSPATAHHISSIDQKTNPWWGLFESACATAGLQIEPEIFPAGTDSRFLRALGIPAFGFSPLANSPILLHEHNEYVDKKVFLDGIKVRHQLFEDPFRDSRLPLLALDKAFEFVLAGSECGGYDGFMEGVFS
jgi:aminoacylase